MAKRPPPDRPRTKADWQKWLNYDVEFATDTLIKSGSLSQQFIIHGRDGAVFPLVTPVFSQGDKRLIRDIVKIFCLAKDAAAVSVMGEAWVTTMPARSGEDLEQALQRAEKEQLPPSKSEVRTEQIFVAMVYYDESGTRQAMSALAEILRGPDGKVTGTSEVRHTAGNIAGQIVDVLSVDRPSWAQVARAKAALAKFKL